MKRYSRIDRVSKLLKIEISKIIREDVKDPRVEGIVITEVIVTKDLRQGKVFFSLYGTKEEKEEALEGLKGATYIVQEELGKHLRMRYTPRLTFYIDDALEKGFEIIEKMKKLRGNEE